MLRTISVAGPGSENSRDLAQAADVRNTVRTEFRDPYAAIRVARNRPNKGIFSWKAVERYAPILGDIPTRLRDPS